MDLQPSTTPARTKVLVIAVVAAGLAVLALGVYLALTRSRSAAAGTDGSDVDTRAWCQLRKEWARRIDAFSGDLLLNGARPDGRDEYETLVARRRRLSGDYSKRVKQMVESDARLWNAVQAVEVALIKEGKTRSNIAVEIHNATTQLPLDDPSVIRRDEDILESRIVRRISEQRSRFDQELKEALAPLKCRGIYRGPLIAEDTADDPYTSWEELRVRRTQALRRVRARLAELEPKEQFANQVYHRLLRNYREALKTCHDQAKKKKPSISNKMGLRVRLKRDGTVQTLGIEWMEIRGDAVLDCLLSNAGSWRLPRPIKGGEAVVVTLDFGAL